MPVVAGVCRGRRRRSGRRRGLCAASADQAAAEIGGPADARDQHEHEQSDRPDPATARPAWSFGPVRDLSGERRTVVGRARLCALERGGDDERHLGGVRAVVARERDQLVLERDLHLPDVREAIVGALGERSRDERLDAVGDLRPTRLHAGHGSPQVLLGDLDERGATVGRHTRQAVVEHRAERVDVGAAVQRVPLRLLGRHVVARAEHAARVGERRRVVDARDAEVGQLGVPIRRQQHVVRLDVTVHDAALVRVGEGRGHLHGDRERLGERQAPLERDALVQVVPVDELADDERAPVRLAAVDDGDDAGVREQGERAGLALEAIDRVGRLQTPRVQELDGHGAAELLVVGLPDTRHPAAPE